MALTPEDIKRLEAPLALEHHEARASGKNKAGTKQQWLIYITQEGVIPLLNSIDPNWTWDVRESSKWDKYAVVTGRLTIKDVFRDGRGGSSPNSASASTDEDTEKGAETDALKRAAVKFGVGLYLRSQPTIWVDISDKSWEDEKAALKQFADWYNREFKPHLQQKPHQPPPSPSAQPTPASVPQTGVPEQQRPNAPVSSTPPTNGTAGASGEEPLFPPLVDGAVIVPLNTEGDDKHLPRDANGLPILGSLDMGQLVRLAVSEKLVSGRSHFANLIDVLWREGDIRAASKSQAVMDAIRKHEAAKDLAKEVTA